MLTAIKFYDSGLGVFPCRPDKTPAIPKGTSWKDRALLPPAEQSWPSGLVGLPIPEGVLLVDMDLYKGVTREEVERRVGCPLPWDQALLQTTQQGGEHYAFRVDWPARTGSNIGGIKGLDTRSHRNGEPQGYICTGNPGYTDFGVGVLRLAHRASLPCLPDQARELFGYADSAPSTTAAFEDTPDLETVASALRSIDPDCSRSLWVKVGMALRTVTDDPSLFDSWSSGELAGREPPANYVPEHVPSQWETFKPDGDTRIGSLYFEAVQAGWRPPSALDTSLAFGAGSADAGLLTKPIRVQLEALAGGVSPGRADGSYGKNHTENAALFLERVYPNQSLVRSDQNWYSYTGLVWEHLDDDDARHRLTVDMAPAFPQASNIAGTYTVLSSLCHSAGSRINEIDPALVLYQNGVLDLRSGYLLAHSPDYFTTNILPYDFAPEATAPSWLAFLHEVFEGDAERAALLQEWFGYMMSNSYEHHKILFMLGPPRSGKGTVGRVMEQVVGSHNFTGASLHSFASDPFLASLQTKTVAFSGDTERRVNRNSLDRVIERLKKISGNDAVEFERKWKSTLSRTLPTRITLAGNSVPNLFDDSGALAGRMMPLPFGETFMNREDLGLTGRLLGELPGIANWALEGLRRLHKQGAFTVPEASQNEAQFIAETYSPLKTFIDSTCTFGGEFRVSCTELYGVYRAWAVQHQEAVIMSRRAFTGAFKDSVRGQGSHYGVHLIDGEVQRGFLGLRLAKVATVSEGAFKPKVAK